MAIFEIFLYVLSLVLVIYKFGGKRILRIYLVGYTLLVLLVFVLHLILESSRWQLIFLYIFWMIGFYYLYKDIVIISQNNKIRKPSAFLIIALLVFGGLVTYAFPVYKMPLVDGDYLIGSQSFVLTDDSRYELYGFDTNLFRKIKIQCWYPAESIDGLKKVPWLEDGLVVSRSLAKDTGLPAFLLDHTTQIMSNSYANAPMDDALSTYPVVIISHGWRGFKNLHTDFAEELASQGYFVVSIDHTYGSVATVFDEDDVAYLNLDALPLRDSTTEFLTFANQLVNTYAGDVIQTIDYLESVNTNLSSDFYGRLDLSSIGLLGHSTGGGGDVTVALSDPRIDALIGLDAWVEPVSEDLMSQSLDIPSLFLRSGQWEIGENNTHLYMLVNQTDDFSSLYQIDGTTHYDFTMVYMYSPLTQLIGFTGDVEGDYLNVMLESIIVEFFDDTLKNNENPAVDLSDFVGISQIETE